VSERGLAAVEYGVRRAEFEATLARQFRGARFDDAPEAPGIAAALREMAEYLNGSRRSFDIEIDWTLLHSDFQRLALQAVYAIPYGEVRTYGQIAAQIGAPQAPRAVGRANATNPMPLVVPCHRVLGSDGRLHGYGGCGGLVTKQWLLDMERGAVRSGTARLVYEPVSAALSVTPHRAPTQRRKS
jgi:methylated-DNA-[protein]-cysteine S-methyltransferase